MREVGKQLDNTAEVKGQAGAGTSNTNQSCPVHRHWTSGEQTKEVIETKGPRSVGVIQYVPPKKASGQERHDKPRPQTQVARCGVRMVGHDGSSARDMYEGCHQEEWLARL